MDIQKIAFIPARKGSKSIKEKNIKLLNGKPLIYWVLEELEKCQSIDHIVVATDCIKTKSLAINFNSNKLVVYDRDAENAKDESSTEDVILEYLKRNEHNLNDIFILCQLTSPLVKDIDFKNCIDLIEQKNYDSVVSCARIKRFFWDNNGTPLNYSLEKRPRRQEMKGTLVENGAIYASRIKNLIKHKNRLSGKIGVYEMTEDTYYELDEITDWIVVERLIKKRKSISSKKIKLFISDVDGVLTDSGMYYDQKGNELKKFNTKDGMGFNLLKKNNIKTAIITSENTKIVESRANKLKIDFLKQGVRGVGKLKAALKICNEININIDQVAYIGDDINCIEILSNVGLAACPKDSSLEIKKIDGINILNKNGGEGVVREFIDIILNCNY